MAPKIDRPRPKISKTTKAGTLSGFLVWTCPLCGETGQGVHRYRYLATADWRWHLDTRCKG